MRKGKIKYGIFNWFEKFIRCYKYLRDEIFFERRLCIKNFIWVILYLKCLLDI